MGYHPWGRKKSDMTEATEHEQNLRSDIPFQGASVALLVKNLLAYAGDVGSIPGSARSPGEENDNPLQYSCQENLMDRRIWQATVHRVSISRKYYSFSKLKVTFISYDYE